MIETKVKAGTAAAAVAGAVLAVIQHLFFTGHAVPAVLQGIVYAVVPGLLALAAGYFAPHTGAAIQPPRTGPPAPGKR